MEDNGVGFEEALCATRAGNLFTTHTSVAAGFDRFPMSLVREYLGEYIQELGTDMERILSLGAGDDGDTFNMAFLAIRASGAVNGVSRLHGEVSRRLFQPLFPRWPRERGPDRSRHQRGARSLLGFPGVRRPLDEGRAARGGGSATRAA